jgi:hypothetical protein
VSLYPVERYRWSCIKIIFEISYILFTLPTVLLFHLQVDFYIDTGFFLAGGPEPAADKAEQLCGSEAELLTR